MSKVRINANVDRGTYEELQKVLKVRRKTVTQFVEECINRFVREETYAQDKQAFDELAKEPITQQFLAVEKECHHDGI